MVDHAAPTNREIHRFRVIGVAAAVVLIVVLALLVSDLPQGVRRSLTLLSLVGSGLVAVAGFGRQVWLTQGRRRRAYGCFALAATLGTGSNLLQLVVPRSGDPAQVVPGDIMLAVALVVGVIGIFSFPPSRRRATDLARMALDGVVIGGSVLLVATVTLFPNVLAAAQRWPLLVVPVIDVVIATFAALLFTRGAGRDRLMVALTAASFLCFAFSDFGFAFITASGRRFAYGSVIDLGWLAGYLLLALAVWAPRRPPTEAAPSVAVETSPVLGTVVMFGLFLTAVGVTVAAFIGAPATVAAVALLLMVVLAVLARQVLLVVDNDQLRRSLEQRVLERTRSLRQATARTDLLVDAVGEGIYGVDQNGLITFVNPAAARALGFAAGSLVGQDAHQMFHADAPDGTPYPESGCYVTEAIRHRRVTSAEPDTYRRADGELLAVEVTATPLSDDGAAVGAVMIFRDVTQRREVDRLKSEFVSMVSHELRTPLTAIQGSLGLISGGALGPVAPAAARMLHIASISSQRLNRLIDDIVDVERIEAGVLGLEPGRHTAAALVETAVGQVQVLADEAAVTLAVGSVTGEIYADPDRTTQTLINLLGNAFKFSPPNTRVLISARPAGAFVEFTVRDEGRGIPDDRLQSIFGRFEQVDLSDSREKGGFGLGLSISKSIVERSGGTIWAANNDDRGAVLRFTLPRADAEPPLSGASAAPHLGRVPTSA